MIKDYLKKVKEEKIDIVNYTKKALDSCKKINKEYNYFNVIDDIGKFNFVFF